MSVFGKLGLTGLQSTTKPAETVKTPILQVEPAVPPQDSKLVKNLSLLASLGNRETEGEVPVAETVPEPIDSEFDTTSLAVVEKATTRQERSIRELDLEAMLQGPTGVREVLDEIDALMGEDGRLEGLYLDQTRKYIKRLMVTLKEHEEFASVLIDKDVHNIMRFVRNVRGEALSLKAVKAEKKATREVKKETRQGKLSSKLSGFDFTMDAGIFENARKK